MKKFYVLDTNVLLYDFTAVYAFGDNTVVLPSVVLEEIDSKKNLMDSVGFNARRFIREVDELRQNGNIFQGIPLANNGVICSKVVPTQSRVYDTFLSFSNDNAILATALSLKGEFPNNPVIVVSLDINVRVKADVVGLISQDYVDDGIVHSSDEKYKGFKVIEDSELIDRFYSNGKVLNIEANENEFILLKSGSQSALGRVRHGQMKALYYFKDEPVWGLTARNVEQKMAIDLLLDPEIPLVTITGIAGSGKTLLSLSAALKQTFDDERYNKVIVARPVVPMGKDIGYLPGEKEEKLRPWMQPIYDNLEFLFNCKTSEHLDDILTGMERQLQVEALTYIRGRTFTNQFIIIDEAQNLTRHEIKTIVTRVGEGSKIVLVGDTEQIDHPYLDQFNNGLAYLIEKMKGEKLFGHVHLQKGERSPLAQLCANLL